MSSEIKCPNCGQTFKVDESLYANIVKQVRDSEFSADLKERVRIEKQNVDNKMAVERKDLQSEISDLRTKLEAEQEKVKSEQKKAQSDLEAAKKQAKTDCELAAQNATADLRNELAQKEADFKIEKQSLQNKIDSFEEKKKNQESQFNDRINNERILHKAELEKQKAALEKQEAENKAELQKQLSEAQNELASERRAKEEIVRMKDAEIKRVTEFKASLSTKGLGDSLEQYCSDLYEQYLRPNLFTASFEKDTKAVDGTKGDFIFRDFDENDEEYISIEFEMKTEADTTSANMRHTNESHMKKLDADRKKKGCEYAVLVSTLEPDSALYNQGIVDVSWKYPKMYVVRPQFFVPIITLLRNAARERLIYKTELAQVKQSNIDLTHFEEKLDKFHKSININVDRAGKKFDAAIKSIDKSIEEMQKARDALVKTKENFQKMDDKVQDMTIGKFTYRNPTVKAAIEGAQEDRKALSSGDERALPPSEA